MAFKAIGRVTLEVREAGLTPRDAINLYIDKHGEMPDVVEPDAESIGEYFEVVGRCEACGLVVMMGDVTVVDPVDGSVLHLLCESADD